MWVVWGLKGEMRVKNLGGVNWVRCGVMKKVKVLLFVVLVSEIVIVFVWCGVKKYVEYV